MKLRSGKVVKQPLPSALEKKLNEDLETLKELLVNNEDFAKELITTIATALSDTQRIAINHMIRDAFNDNTHETQEGVQNLLITSSSLLRLVIGNHSVYSDYNIEPIFHDAIEQCLLDTFDISLIGAI